MKKLIASLTEWFATVTGTLSENLSPYLVPLQDKAMDRWDELNSREQLIVSALGATVILAFFMVLIYIPLIKQRDQAQAVYESRVELLTWMMSVAPQVKGQGSDVNSASAQSMMNEVNQRAAAYQLTLDRVQPEGTNKLRVWMETESFDSIMRWLTELQEESGIVASSVSFDAESVPGVINAKVVLQGSD